MNHESTPVRFDDSLGRFVRAVLEEIDVHDVVAGWFLRDSSGLLTYVAPKALDKETKDAIDSRVVRDAFPYARQGWAAVDIDYPGVRSIIERATPYHETVLFGSNSAEVNVVDQRIVGADWLVPPANASEGTPRYVFASIKGGVGRTTALAVVARDMALRGMKVLVIDLDLEAPGIGSILLNEDERPEYGMLDGYVESALVDLDADFLFNMSAASHFGEGKGLIDVVPAVGTKSNQYPANVLAKLARAYVESSSIQGNVSFGERTRFLVEALATLKRYDVILIDARAGLNEATAPAILNLGAKVLLFGEDTPQTFAGYRYLLAHLARFERNPDDDWLSRLRMIHAKASTQADKQQLFRDKAHEIFQEFLYGVEDLPEGEIEMPEYSLDDPEAPHFAIPILRDSNYVEFDPLSEPAQLTTAVYERTYEALLRSLPPSQ